MTYRVPKNYFSTRTRLGNSPRTFNDRVKRKGYESATPVYGPEYMTKGSRGNKGKLTRDLIGYDAVAMTRVEYRPAPAPTAPAKSIAEAAPKETPGKGANRGTVGSLGTATGAGVAGTAQAGNVGSVNTEVQNDDVLLPYQKV